MSRFDQMQLKLLGLAFIVGPLLLVTAALTFLAGIGVSSYGVSSWVEGVLMTLAFLLFVPIYLHLARVMGQRAPRLGLVCTVTGLGIGLGMLPANARITQAGLDQAGVDVAVFSLQAPGQMVLVLWMGLGLLTTILLGIGFLVKGGLPRWTAVLLILAPIVFVMGQGGDESIAWWQVNIMYPLGCLLYFAAFAPIGWRYLTQPASNLVNEIGGQTAVA
ncbi:MAG TPA: hypothetical protein PLD25_21295 [Chloroflexota bacterium]|nr:hypothetical protein [Chloroflexota bacterium]